MSPKKRKSKKDIEPVDIVDLLDTIILDTFRQYEILYWKKLYGKPSPVFDWTKKKSLGKHKKKG